MSDGGPDGGDTWGGGVVLVVDHEPDLSLERKRQGDGGGGSRNERTKD